MWRRLPFFLAFVMLLVPGGCDDEPPVVELPVPFHCIGPAGCVMENLARTYQLRDEKLLAALLANDPDSNAEFLFTVTGMDTEQPQWGNEEMLRIHQRLFHPESSTPGDAPLPPEAWLQSLSISLIPNEVFAERPDLYSVDGGADGKLDPARWRAMDAQYSLHVFLDLAGDTDYSAEGSGNFVVIEDLTKDVAVPGKYLLYIWEDICPDPEPATTQTVETTCLSRILAMYR